MIQTTKDKSQMLKKTLFILITISLISACKPSVEKLNNQGNEAFYNQDYQAAQQAYLTAQSEAPDKPEPYYNAANNYYKQEDYEQAQFQVQQALRDADEALAQSSFYNLGNVYYNSQQFEQAAEAYKQALRLDPNDQVAKHNLELALQQLQEQEQEQQQQDQNQEENEEEQEDQEEQEEQEQEQQEQEQQDQEQQNQEQQEEESQSEQNQEENQEESESEQQQSEQSEGSEQSEEEQGQPQSSQEMQPLTPDQARQLLESIAEDSQTLQQFLQLQQGQPGTPPERDW